MTIREETGADAAEIAALTRAAFGGEYEVNLIEKLRAIRLVIVSLVSVEEGVVVGHILFSELSVDVWRQSIHGFRVGPRFPVRRQRFCYVSGVRGLEMAGPGP